jgi:uncharacterized damage-inducible protein DinB
MIAKLKNYVFTTMETTPILQKHLLSAYGEGDPIYDHRPFPNRFTLREMLAHLADWDDIFLMRIRRAIDEDVPTLPDIDVSKLAVEHAYATQSPIANLARFAANRATLVAYLTTIPDSGFERSALRETLGVMTVDKQLFFILAHDGYHNRQTVDYIAAAPE